ncbi:hypothetical protein BGZ89_011403, partial [Linnemannia elongata]
MAFTWKHKEKEREKEREKEKEKEAAALTATFNSALQIKSTPPTPVSSATSPPSNGHSQTPSSSSIHSTTPPTSGHSPSPSGQTNGTVGRNEGGAPKNGLLIIRVVEARGLTLPPGSSNPPFVPKQQQQTTSNRESLQRKWWLPYAVLEFDKNEVLIDALGGELSNPVWQYRAH